MRVLFVGAYGIRNIGDDAMLLAWADGLKQRDNSVQTTIMSRHSESEYHYYEKYGINVIPNLDHPSAEKAGGKRFFGLNDGDSDSHLIQIRQEIEKTDLIVMGGGDAFVDLTTGVYRGPSVYLALICTIAKFFRKPVIVAGVTVVPFYSNTGLDLTRHILENAKFVIFRDKASYKVLENYGLLLPENKWDVLPDPALGLNRNYTNHKIPEIARMCAASRANKVKIGISIRDLYWKEADEKSYIDKLVLLCNTLIEEFQAYLVFIPHSCYEKDDIRKDDRPIASRISRGIEESGKHCEIQKYLDVEGYLALYSSLDLVIGMRHHSMVLSALVNVPPIALTYSEKVTNFMNDIMMGENTFDVNHFSVEAVTNKVKHLLAKDVYDQEREKLSGVVNNKRILWNKYIDYMFSIMNSS